MSRFRGFCFTINNPTEDDLTDSYMCFVNGAARYIIMADEIGEKGTPHIQGYVYFNDAHTMKVISDKYFPRAHIEVAKANGSKAYRRADYCKKDGKFVEFGEEPHPGEIGKEYLDSIMSDPYSNIHVYNQYRKMYRELSLSKKKDHVRELRSLSHELRYDVASEYNTVFMDADINNYDGQEVVFSDCYMYDYWQDWFNGYPHSVRRGYELIVVDPRIVYLVFTTVKEEKFLEKKDLTRD